jgi:hypothetical protein
MNGFEMMQAVSRLADMELTARRAAEDGRRRSRAARERRVSGAAHAPGVRALEALDVRAVPAAPGPRPAGACAENTEPRSA